ncbi:hypothetical protein H2200_011607 [Cladophialophora chaetospira]|uniref:Uncharacterized protein n=1 Tax=Cladophialophora chaetospira TaxID=386627 RepID=A0AA39CDB6_9EURO|nr:hypothetical protein H2200_011607 [Cladophialophora chaetospira]
MCHIELQYFLHCKSTDVYFRSCRDRGVPHESNFQAEIHAFDRPCPLCFNEAVLAVEEHGDISDNTNRFQNYPRSLDVMRLRQKLDWNYHNDEDAEMGYPMYGNVDWKGCPQLALVGGEIDHEEAQREFRTRFSSIPLCEYNMAASELSQDTVRRDEQGITSLQEPQTTDETKEVVVCFGGCEHVNTFFCPVVWEWPENSGRYQSQCGCSGYDEHLRLTVGYAESEQCCLICRLEEGGFDRDHFKHFKDLVRSDIPKKTWDRWSYSKETEDVLRNPIATREWRRHPQYARSTVVEYR